MAVSIVESQIGAVASASGVAASATVTLSTTPVAGDVVFVLVSSSASDVGETVSGLGATWTQAEFLAFNNANARYHIWKGTGATAAGTITVSVTASSTNFQAGALLVRGLLSSNITYHAQSSWQVSDNVGNLGLIRQAKGPVGPSALALAIFLNQAPNTVTIQSDPGDTPGWTLLPGMVGGFTFAALPVNASTSAVQITAALPSGTGPGFYLSYVFDVIGGPDGARAQAAYLEAATSNPGAARLDGTYLEAAISNPGAVRADGVYLETLALTVTQLKEYGAYLEVLTGPPPKPSTVYYHGWGLVVPSH